MCIMLLCFKHNIFSMKGENKKMAIHLKAARVNAGYTQRGAAKALGISKGTLANYENYKTKPDIEMSKKIAALYNTTVDDIVFFAK